MSTERKALLMYRRENEKLKEELSLALSVLLTELRVSQLTIIKNPLFGSRAPDKAEWEYTMKSITDVERRLRELSDG